MNKLPIYQGYSVDFRLKEFRKAIFGKALEFIPFESEAGQKLMTGFLKTALGKSMVSRSN